MLRGNRIRRADGIEVLFEIELDHIIRVTNDKQSATFFGNLGLEEHAANADMTPLEFDLYPRESNAPAWLSTTFPRKSTRA